VSSPDQPEQPPPGTVGVEYSAIIDHLGRIIASQAQQLAIARALLDVANAELDTARQERVADAAG
jgi:hypothetical protein